MDYNLWGAFCVLSYTVIYILSSSERIVSDNVSRRITKHHKPAYKLYSSPVPVIASPGNVSRRLPKHHNPAYKLYPSPLLNKLDSSPLPVIECSKNIQYWGGPKLTLADGEYYCPDVNCHVTFTSQRSYSITKKSHVVIFHHLGTWDISHFERNRPPGQILAYMSRESPALSLRSNDLSAFNWTITYRSESDFPIPYGIMKKTKTALVPNKNWALGKTKLVAWFGSNCDRIRWPRTEFVKNLSKFIDIDMFGNCGNLVCRDRSCLGKINSYKFYLALENNMCTDYITEKMWKNSFQHDTVPVVYGTTRSNYETLAPRNSFIHVNDFNNMSSLASYLKVLDGNDTMYNSFFQWREDWEVETLRVYEVITADTLCKMVNKLATQEETHSSLEDKNKWFRSCFDAPLLNPV